jgi:segregation and condensation protein A
LNRVLSRLPARTVMELEGEAYDIEDKIERIQGRVRVAGKLSFETLLGECRSRLEMIVTFLALLELLKMNRLSAIQDGNFGEIVLAPPSEADAASEWDTALPSGDAHGNE